MKKPRADVSAGEHQGSRPEQSEASVAHPPGRSLRLPNDAKRRGGRASELQASIAHAPAKRPGAQPGRAGRPQAAAVEDPGVCCRAHTCATRRRWNRSHNALRHGYYSSIFKATERRLLDQIPLTDLSAEIELIRVTNKRFLKALAASKGDLDFETQLTALRAVNLSAHSIATLLRAHALTAAVNRAAQDALRNLDDLPPEDDGDKP